MYGSRFLFLKTICRILLYILVPIFFIWYIWPTPTPKPPALHLCYKDKDVALITTIPSFNFSRDSSFCPSTLFHDKTQTIVAVIHSARDHFLNRHLIRSTWGTLKSRRGWSLLALAFFVGGPNPNSPEEEERNISLRLEAEQKEFGDLVLSNSFVDSYKNMTIKAIMVYEWLAHCWPDVTLVLKTDDDIFVNWSALLPKFLNRWSSKGIEKKSEFHCMILGKGKERRTKAERNCNSTYYTSRSEYPWKMYPKFCRGLAYFTTIPTVRKVLSVVDKFEWKLWIDDTFLMGLAVEKYNKLLDSQKEIEGEIKLKRETPIEFVTHEREWYFWPYSGSKDNETDLMEWKQGVRNRIFYLVQHGQTFERQFRFLNKTVGWSGS